MYASLPPALLRIHFSQ